MAYSGVDIIVQLSLKLLKPGFEFVRLANQTVSLLSKVKELAPISMASSKATMHVKSGTLDQAFART